MPNILVFNKPYDVLCQFTDSDNRTTLKHYLDDAQFDGFYPAGRLDRDSEGLVVLTNNGILQHRITDPQHKLSKTYWVQVEGIPNWAALEALRDGVQLKDGVTLPAQADLIAPPTVWLREPPIRKRAAIPTQWLALTLTEGRNRQVRRMTARVGHPTLRLIRVQIGPWKLANVQPGEHRLEYAELPQPVGRPAKKKHPRSLPLRGKS